MNLDVIKYFDSYASILVRILASTAGKAELLWGKMHWILSSYHERAKLLLNMHIDIPDGKGF